MPIPLEFCSLLKTFTLCTFSTLRSNEHLVKLTDTCHLIKGVLGCGVSRRMGTGHGARAEMSERWWPVHPGHRILHRQTWGTARPHRLLDPITAAVMGLCGQRMPALTTLPLRKAQKKTVSWSIDLVLGEDIKIVSKVNNIIIIHLFMSLCL